MPLTMLSILSGEARQRQNNLESQQRISSNQKNEIILNTENIIKTSNKFLLCAVQRHFFWNGKPYKCDK